MATPKAVKLPYLKALTNNLDPTFENWRKGIKTKFLVNVSEFGSKGVKIGYI